MKYTDSILDDCIQRVHAQVLHERALQGKALPEFSSEYWKERNLAKNKIQADKWKASVKAKGAAR